MTMDETVEERARRLGLIPSTPTPPSAETVAQRAARLGLSVSSSAPKPPVPIGHNGVPFIDANPAEGTPGVGTKALGVIAALNRDIPGAEFAQSRVRALLRSEPVSQALTEIRGAEDAAPVAATLPARLVGSGLSLAALPGGAAMKGALYGGLSGAGDADEQSGESRAAKSVLGAVIGGAGGAVGAKAARVVGKIGGPVLRAGRYAAGGVADAMESLPQAVEGALYPPEVMRAGAPAARVAATQATHAPVVAAENAVQQVPASQAVLEAIKNRPVSHAPQSRFDYIAQLMAKRLGGSPPP